MYSVSSSRPQQGKNKHQAVAVHDGRCHALVDGVRRSLLGLVAAVPIELQLVSSLPACKSWWAAQRWRTSGGYHTCPASPAPAWWESQSRTTSLPSPLCQQVDVRGQEHNVLPLVEGLSQVSVKQRTLQFLISRWKLMWARRSSSLLSKACTLANRMLGREDPCSWDCSRCPPWCFLPCWSGWIDGCRDGLACLCGWGCSWCLSPPPFPWHLHVWCKYDDVYIWKPWLARQRSWQEESPQSCESTISLSWWATCSHMPSLYNVICKKCN